MKIGIIGVGFIGASLARAWAKLWHQLTIPWVPAGDGDCDRSACEHSSGGGHEQDIVAIPFHSLRCHLLCFQAFNQVVMFVAAGRMLEAKRERQLPIDDVAVATSWRSAFEKDSSHASGGLATAWGWEKGNAPLLQNKNAVTTKAVAL